MTHSPSPKPITLADLRRYAIARSLFKPTTLSAAITRLGFVQADPIRAPARAQDLTLRHRVKGYLAGDLERRYTKLPIEEDYFVNYGFLGRETLKLMHPRVARRVWTAETRAQAEAIHAFIRERGPTHPREVQKEFKLGQTRNAWGGQSNATTHLLDGMHYRGLLRVQRREQGQRIYASVDHEPDLRSNQEKAKALLELVLAKYAPLPSRTLSQLCNHLRYGAPHLTAELKRAQIAARKTLPNVDIDGVTWFWPEGEDPKSNRFQLDEEARLLAPFDPIVWDRHRFELFWGWAYRFEAYTPAAKRKLGYYALPLLWRGEVRGWANLSVENDQLHVQLGHLNGKEPKQRAFREALQAELLRFAAFMGVLPPVDL